LTTAHFKTNSFKVISMCKTQCSVPNSCSKLTHCANFIVYCTSTYQSITLQIYYQYF